MACNSHNIDQFGLTVGYRPVLQVDSSKLTSRDSLKPVTLFLTKGSFRGQSMIHIVSAGSTYTAPPALGLTDPNGKPVTSAHRFSWNTSPDGKGQEYIPGATVPSSVTILYADWGTSMQGIDNVTIQNDKIISIDYTAFIWSNIVVAFYKDGQLIQTKLYRIADNRPIGDIDIPVSANSIKVMMWKYDMDNMQPYGLPIELVKGNGSWSKVKK